MGIENVPRTFVEIRDWADEYEKRAMVPNETTHEFAEITMGILLYHTPKFLKGLVKTILIGFMDDRLRNAMLYPPSPKWVTKFIPGFFTVRRFLLRNFFLPRWKGIHYTTMEKNKYGRYNTNYADNEVHFLLF